MFRLLIVDDEAIIADGLCEVLSSIREVELDIYKAYSGQEALNLLNRTRIDIVLTDICMPGMTGIQLLETIHSKWPECKVIFLTGHSEFEYVYTAIQSEGVSYILKTEGYGKIIDTVTKTALKIEENLKSTALVKQAQEQLGTTKNLLQTIFLRGILNEEISMSEIKQQQFDELEIPLSMKEPVVMMAGRIDDIPKGIPYSVRTEWFISIRLIAEQYISVKTKFVCFNHDNSTIVWFLQPVTGEKRRAGEEDWNDMLTFIKGIAELMQESFANSTGKSISFVLDDTPVSWRGIQDRYFTLKMLLNYRIGKGEGLLLSDTSLLERDLQNHSRIVKDNSVRNRAVDLAEILENGTKEDFLSCLMTLSEKLAAIQSMHDIVAVEQYYSIALVILSHINKWNLTEKIAFKISMYKLMNLEYHESWKYAVEYLKQLGEILFEIKDSEEEKRAQDVIGIVQKHINEHLHLQDEVSLVRLAEIVYFNPSYLSRLFKQVTGKNLSDYISECRIKKAKKLLENPDYKIHEISEAVGYLSATNFARFFKKITSMTPQEYRDSKLIK
ncbi:HTH-type transcriptional regulator YesS [Ruminiclostridium hungatei]|uniref:Stage 0 sporulation protein A homolog n=1 Tax=Ruminiclostridium hungatei TaxID=48256 RepID=A0A1V4SQX6_RUMHU|nr:response regulator [Ruminiclostridium hungatei]OPX45691.1 HTH-type transcriptional regulator YesS [Ruminiclostridium hungatei]